MFKKYVVLFTLVLAAFQSHADEFLKESGVKGGLVVILGCDAPEAIAEIMADDSFRVSALDADVGNVTAAREYFHSKGISGKVTADVWDGGKLPYADNLVNSIVMLDPESSILDREIERVLAPRGVLITKEGNPRIPYPVSRIGNGLVQYTKPVPSSIDSWTHYMHDPGNNAVAQDTVIGPPRRMQWLGGPRWSRHHDHVASMNAMVTSGSKLFYIMDEGLTASVLTPPDWNLVARDAFNGIILWKKDISDWVPTMWPLKAGPANLPRRLVAVDDTVYVTMGFTAPVSALSADTGESIRTYAGSKNTEEIIVVGDTLLTVNIIKPFIVPPTPGALKEAEGTPIQDRRISKSPLITYYWKQAQSTHWFDSPRVIRAYRASTGEKLWDSEAGMIMPLSMGSDGKKVFYHDGAKIAALDLASGKKVFDTEAVPVARERMQPFFAPTLVVKDGVIVFAGGENIGHAWMGWEKQKQGQDTMTAFSADTGKKLWSAPHPYGGYQSPEDVLIADGLVWAADTAKNGAPGPWIGRELKTGEIAKEIPPTVKTRWFHHRCYRAKATEKYMLPSRNGIEFIDINKKEWGINHWVRSGCLYGIMPANGFVYTSPHNCACHPQAKLYGFNALAPAAPERQGEEIGDKRQERLVKGAAYGKNLEHRTSHTEHRSDWPMYRGDVRRSGATADAVPAQLEKLWEVDLGGGDSGAARYLSGMCSLTQPVSVGDLLVVASVDRHTVYAFDNKSGKQQWKYIAGGRIDSSPTLFNGRVIFGSRDGYVTCLRASDGELVWKFLAAPEERKIMVFGQLESVWPVYGSVLIDQGEVMLTAGRSFFLDGGVHFYRLDAESGKILAHKTFGPEDVSGEGEIQDSGGLDMPVGMPDILSADGESIFMRAQVMDRDGNRTDKQLHHLFSPYGFVDGSWFHRAYWLYGEDYYGGCGGYPKAGRKYPSGKMIVHDDDNVYAYGREQKYFKWITEMEYHLFSSPRAENEKEPEGYNKPAVQAAVSSSLNIKGKPYSAEAWFRPNRGDGVVFVRGATAAGFDVTLVKGKVMFSQRVKDKLYKVRSKAGVNLKQWNHVAVVLTESQNMRLYLNGELAGTAKSAFQVINPAEGIELGMDDGGQLWERSKKCTYSGWIDEFRMYDGVLTDTEVKKHAADSAEIAAEAKLVLHYNFDDGAAKDLSGNGNDGTLGMVEVADAGSAHGKAIEFKRRKRAARVKFNWSSKIPVHVRAMVKAGDNVFVAGTEDIVDEQESILDLYKEDTASRMARQEALYAGAKGGVMQVYSAMDGSKKAEYKLGGLPVFDGMSAAGGKLYYVTEDGKLTCLQQK